MNRNIISIVFIALSISLPFLSCRKAFQVDMTQKMEIPTPTKSLLQAISVTPKKTIYVSGHNATVLRKFENESSFTELNIAVPDSFQFRDIHGFDNGVVVAMSAGSGIMSQIWRSEDFGDSWVQVFEMDDPDGFLDCMDFWNEERGLIFGDAIDGMYVLETLDGGKNWNRISSDAFPSQEATGGFAASGTCVETVGDGVATIIGYLPNRETPLYISTNYGKTWTRDSLALVVDEVAGGTSFSSNQKYAIAAGGDLMTRSDSTLMRLAARTPSEDWSVFAPKMIGSALYGSAIGPKQSKVVSIVGPGGWAISVDAGRKFTLVDEGNFWATEVTGDQVIAVGRGGKVVVVPVAEFWD